MKKLFLKILLYISMQLCGLGITLILLYIYDGKSIEIILLDYSDKFLIIEPIVGLIMFISTMFLIHIIKDINKNWGEEK